MNTTKAPPHEKTGYLTDDNGTPSSMRVMSFISLIAAIIFAYILMVTPQPDSNHVFIVFAFLLSAFAPKALQKYSELMTQHKK